MTASASPTPRSIRFLGWAVLLSIWMNVGLYLLINGILLREVVSESTTLVRLPESTRESIWLVVTIWLVAYGVGFIIGLAPNWPRRDLIGSSVAGYVIAILLYLMLLGVFPGTPRNSYDVLRNVVSFQPLPVYYIFVFLTLVLGPIVSGLATYTSILITRDMPNLRLPTGISLDGAAIIFGLFGTLSVMMLLVAIPNATDADQLSETTRDYRAIVRDHNRVANSEQQETLPTIVLLHLDRTTHVGYSSAIAIIVGMFIGVKLRTHTHISAALNATIGVGLYVLSMFLILELIEPKTTANINYEDVYGDHLGHLPAPSALAFVAFWFIPPLVAAGSALVLRVAVNTALTSPQHVTVD